MLRLRFVFYQLSFRFFDSSYLFFILTILFNVILIFFLYSLSKRALRIVSVLVRGRMFPVPEFRKWVSGALRMIQILLILTNLLSFNHSRRSLLVTSITWKRSSWAHSGNILYLALFSIHKAVFDLVRFDVWKYLIIILHALLFLITTLQLIHRIMVALLILLAMSS